MGLLRKRTPDVSTIGSRILEAPALVVKPIAPVYRALTNLPPFRPVVVNLMQTFDRDDAGPAEISRLIEADPSLTSEVLACANSALFGVSASVTNLTQAIMLLGLDRVRALSTVIALRTMMEGAPKAPPLRRCWKHSIACALIARDLAPAYHVPSEQAYTAGILHDVGRLVYWQATRTNTGSSAV
jgi:HD-like signal output (HDOD) protein